LGDRGTPRPHSEDTEEPLGGAVPLTSVRPVAAFFVYEKHNCVYTS
jgi:hypothetical protein